MASWHDAAACSAVDDDAVLGLHVEGRAIAIFKIDGEFYALKDLCSHGQARLSDGYVEDGCVECPLHQGLVDIRTGAARTAPITVDIPTYPVRVSGERLEVEF